MNRPATTILTTLNSRADLNEKKGFLGVSIEILAR